MIRLKVEKYIGGIDFEFFWQEKNGLCMMEKKREREIIRIVIGKEQLIDIVGNGKCYYN